jgi:uncharacterized protein
MYLLDINLWLALVFESHFHHRIAKAWFDDLPNESCTFCRMTQQGFLRLATNPWVLFEDAVSLRDAWGLYDTMLGDPRVIFAPEPPALESAWRAYTQNSSFSTKIWNDAFLAAFAQGASLSLVTFDRGLTQYRDVACTSPNRLRFE